MAKGKLTDRQCPKCKSKDYTIDGQGSICQIYVDGKMVERTTAIDTYHFVCHNCEFED